MRLKTVQTAYAVTDPETGARVNFFSDNKGSWLEMGPDGRVTVWSKKRPLERYSVIASGNVVDAIPFERPELPEWAAEGLKAAEELKAEPIHQPKTKKERAA